MTPTQEDYARLAEKIGLRLAHYADGDQWEDLDSGEAFEPHFLPFYLADPAQMSRILRAVPLTVGAIPEGGWWAYTDGMGELGYEEIQRVTPEEAVRDCAALALREVSLR